MATSIGNLVVELQANTAKFTNDLERARGATKQAASNISASLSGVSTGLSGVERSMKTVGAGAAQLGHGFRETGSVIHEVGNDLARTLSPALGQAVGNLRSLGREVANMPVGLGLLVAGLAVAGFGLTKFIERVQASIKLASEIQTATRGGDRGALEGLLQQRIKETDEAVETLKRSGNAFTNIMAGDFAGALEKVYANFAKDFVRSSERIQSEAADIAKALVALIPLAAQQATADYAVTMVRLASTTAAFKTGLAQSGQDLDAFTEGIERQRQASTDLASALEKAAKAKLALAEREIRGKTFLAPEAQHALLGEARAGAGREVQVIAEEALQRDAALLEQLRTGTEQINAQRNAGIIANIEAEIAGYEDELGVLRRLDEQAHAYYEGLRAQETAGLIEGIEKNIAEYEDELNAIVRVNEARHAAEAANEAVAISLERELQALQLTGREAAVFADQIRLGADASNELRTRVGEASIALFEFKERQERIAEISQIATTAAQQLGSALYDSLVSGSDDIVESIKKIIHEINKMIIALLIAKAIQAGTNALFGGGSIDTSSAGVSASGGGMASGGIVRHRPGGSWRLLGEGGQDEAVIPLNRMSQIGEQVGPSHSGPLVEVHIENRAEGTSVERQTSKGSDGRVIERFIISTMEGAIGNGALDKSMSANYGLKRRGVSR